MLPAPGNTPYIVHEQFLTLAGTTNIFSLTLDINDVNFYAQGQDEGRIILEAYDEFGGQTGFTLTFRPYQQIRGAVQINYLPEVLPGKEFFGIHVGTAGDGVLTADLSDIRVEDLASYTLLHEQWHEAGIPIPGATTRLFTLSPARALRLRATDTALNYKATYINTRGYQHDINGEFRPLGLAITVSRPGFAHDGAPPAPRHGYI